MSLIDISVTLSVHLAGWPGDQPFSTQATARIQDGSSVNLTALTLSPHSGTHVDAPLHFSANGVDSAQIPLSPLIGPCRVVSVNPDPAQGPIAWCELESQLTGIPVGEGVRLLLNTGYQRRNPFNPDFRYPAADPIQALAARGTLLLGSDAASVDAFSSQDLPNHHACLAYGITILENLQFPPNLTGDFELLALPLKIEGGEAAPVRAVLRRTTPLA